MFNFLKPKYIHKPIKEVVIKDSSSCDTGRVAVVTGATGSIGGEIVKRLLSDGNIVVAIGRNEEKLKKLSELSPKIFYKIMDLSNADDIEKQMSSIYGEFGRIDILVNCAGCSARDGKKKLVDQSVDVIDEMLDVNLRGAMLCTKSVGKYMMNAHYGRIINISSIVGMQGKDKHAEYSAAKGGLIAFTKSMAIELGQYGITVNAVSPGLIPRENATDEKLYHSQVTNRLDRVGTASDIAYAVSFFAGEESAFITGQNLPVDGGRSIGLMGD